MARIKIIVAVSENGVIGCKNDLPWNLPTDLKHFKSVTEGHIVIMGRKCWESIPDQYKPLKNRLNIVLTRDSGYKADGAIVYNNLYLAIKDYRLEDKDIFIIGGGKIYEQSFGLADTLYLTRIMNNIDGDILLNGFKESEWDIFNRSEIMEENGFKFCFEKYKSKKNFSLAIVGSRGFDDYELLKSALSPYIKKTSFMVSGNADGADKLGEKWADENNIEKLIFKPDWKKHGKSAGVIRNKTIVENSDLIIAFWDGKSKGTKHTIDISQKLNKDILIINF